jgi:hypothetical protein
MCTQTCAGSHTRPAPFAPECSRVARKFSSLSMCCDGKHDLSLGLGPYPLQHEMSRAHPRGVGLHPHVFSAFRHRRGHRAPAALVVRPPRLSVGMTIAAFPLIRPPELADGVGLEESMHKIGISVRERVASLLREPAPYPNTRSTSSVARRRDLATILDERSQQRDRTRRAGRRQ